MLTGIDLKHFIRQVIYLILSEQHRLVEVITIGTIKVAGWAYRLDEDLEFPG